MSAANKHLGMQLHVSTFYPFDTRTGLTKMKIEFSSLLLCSTYIRKGTRMFFTKIIIFIRIKLVKVALDLN